MRKLTSLYISSLAISDEGIKNLLKLRNLEILEMNECGAFPSKLKQKKVTALSFFMLGKLPNLSQVFLLRMDLSKFSLSYLSQLPAEIQVDDRFSKDLIKLQRKRLKKVKKSDLDYQILEKIEEMKHIEPFKILILGKPQTGRSSLVNRYISNDFIETEPTLEEYFETKFQTDEGKSVNLEIMDISGIEGPSRFISKHIQRSDGFILTYNISNEDSFLFLRNIKEMIDESKDEDIEIVVAGTFCDLEKERAVSFEQGLKMSEKIGAKFFETSAKQDINVRECFEETIKGILRKNEILRILMEE